MAKWGEGDPRWIVEERPDATNVNNWHWSEKDATAWSRSTLQELLSDLAVDSAAGSARTTDVTVNGEATANNRKAKLIFFYELTVDVKWKGTTADGTDINGKIHIPNLSEENEIDEVEVEVTMKSASTPESSAVKKLLRDKMRPIVTEQLHKWLKKLKEEYSMNLVLPTKAPAAAAPAPPQEVKKTTGVKIHSENKKTVVGEISCSSFSLSEEFQCPAQILFEALMDEQRVSAYTQAEAKIDSRVGGAFSMFGGNVTGVIKDLVPHRKIVQAWRFSSWAEGHFSEVHIDLSEGSGKTVLTLKHAGVPDSDVERAKEGWSRLQFARLKMFFGLGGPSGFM